MRDAKSDVFVADYGAQQIVEYAHGATKPIRTISDAPYDPYDCSVDPATGSLAVANAGGSSGEGNIAVYSDASSTPTYYTDSHLSDFQSCVYDADGNLLVTNGYLRRSGVASFAWLPYGGTKLIDVNVPGPIPTILGNTFRDFNGTANTSSSTIIRRFIACFAQGSSILRGRDIPRYRGPWPVLDLRQRSNATGYASRRRRGAAAWNILDIPQAAMGSITFRTVLMLHTVLPSA